MKMSALENAPLHIRAAALALWCEWMADGRKSKGFSVTIQVTGSKARVTGYNPFEHACADAETNEAEFVDRK